MPTTPDTQRDEIRKQERVVLEKYGLRWAVLATWQDQLGARGLPLPKEATEVLMQARVLISSGCFSSCQVGCLLSDVEGMLVSAEGSSPRSRSDFWLDLLGQVMEGSVAPGVVLAIPGVKGHLSECGVAGCACAG